MKPWVTVLACSLALSGPACSAPDAPAELSVAASGVTPLFSPTQLTVPTYEGSGQAVHPDVLWFPRRWGGWAYWMAFSPYPKGNGIHENPSIVVSQDGKTWQVPPGLVNPILPRPDSARSRSKEEGTYNSDPDLSYDAANDRLVLLNRAVRGGFNIVSVLWSTNGIHWSAPHEVIRRRNHGIISPTISLGPAGKATIWYVDGGTKRCRERVTRVMQQTAVGANPLASAAPSRGWTPPRPAGLDQPGQFIWHLDVTWIESRQEYWAVYPAYPVEHCGAHDLFFARSVDGRTWTTYAVPFLRHEDQAWTMQTLYRASVIYDETRGVMGVFFSGAAPGNNWRLGYVEFDYARLLVALQRASAPVRVSGQSPPASPPTEASGAEEP